MLNVTIYHNDESRFMPYEPGQHLIIATSHWLPSSVGDPLAVADWAFRTFNTDLALLEGHRDTHLGEVTFLAACVFRLLGFRSLTVGDVVEVASGPQRHFLACESVGWRTIATPSNVSGQPLTAAKIRRRLAERPPHHPV